MADPRGFLTTARELPPRRPVDVRISDWREVYEAMQPGAVEAQAGRCMDCGIPFCHNGCPLGNLIPEWNELGWRGDWQAAIERLHATNNFPEFTGRLCPAPCETACVLGINADPVTIKQVEVSIIDKAWDEGWVTPQPPSRLTGRTVAVVGSGPAGLAAAQQLTRAGHTVAVLERSDRIGGLLRYGIPEFKMEKSHLDRRIAQMEAEGTRFRPGVSVGVDITGHDLHKKYDAVVLAVGATQWRELEVPGRQLAGVHQAMEFLPHANRVQEGDLEVSPISAAGKHVVILGGGDTGADCLGTAHRHGAKSVTQYELMPRPPEERTPAMPWPSWPMILRVSAAHEEGGGRDFGIKTTGFSGDNGVVTKLHAVRLTWEKDASGRTVPKDVPGSEFTIDCDLCLLAMGYVHPEHPGPIEKLGLALDDRGNVRTDENFMASVPGVFAAGDMRRGQSLVVWAIAEGRKAARAIDAFLMGRSDL